MEHRKNEFPQKSSLTFNNHRFDRENQKNSLDKHEHYTKT